MPQVMASSEPGQDPEASSDEEQQGLLLQARMENLQAALEAERAVTR